MNLRSWISIILLASVGSVILAQTPAAKAQPSAPANGVRAADLGEKLDIYLGQLKQGSVEQRREAVLALGHIGERAGAAVPGLVKCLKAKDVYARIYAAEGLWQLKKDPAALVVLIDELKNKDVRMRQSTAEILSRFGTEAKAAVPALVEALNDTAGVRSNALLALWRIAKHPDVVPALVRDLNGERGDRYSAAHVLTEIGGEAKAAVPALLEALKDTSAEYMGAHVPVALGLWRIDKNPAVVPALIDHLKDPYLSSTIGALSQIGMDAKAAAPALAELLKHEQVVVRRSAASALAVMGEEPTVWVSLLIEDLKHERDDVRKYSAVSLGALGAKAKAAVPALIEAAREQTIAEPPLAPGAPKGYLGLEKVVMDIHVGLGIEQLRPGGPADKAGLKRGDVITSVNDTSVTDIKGFRAEIAKLPLKPGDKVTFMIQRGDAPPKPVVVIVSASPKPGELRVLPGFGASRLTAAIALWKINKHPAAVPALAAALKDPLGGFEAAGVLGRIGVGAKSAVPALIEALKEENVYRRVSAAEALWKIEKNPAAAPALVEFLKERKATGYDRIYTARALWEINKSPAATTALLEVLKKGEDAAVRASAAEALWQINRSPAAVPVLIESEAVHTLARIGLEANATAAALTGALKDEDEKVRTSAAHWLKKIGPEAAKQAGVK